MANARLSASNKPRPWTTRQLSEFLCLHDAHAAKPIRPYNRLIAGDRGRVRAEMDDEHWKALAAHSVGRALLRKSECKEMLKCFDRARNKVESHYDGEALETLSLAQRKRIRLLLAPTARAEFLCVLAFCAHSAFSLGWTKPRPVALPSTRRRAIKHTEGLLGAIRNGALGFDDYGNESILRELLTRLLDSLTTRARRREVGRDAARRACLSGFASHLKGSCGWASRGALIQFAKLVDMPCNEKLAQRIIKGHLTT
jgi:hypothetical protein